MIGSGRLAFAGGVGWGGVGYKICFPRISSRVPIWGAPDPCVVKTGANLQNL